MRTFGSLDPHPTYRLRRLRWVLPTVGLFFIAMLATLGWVYYAANQDIGTEFFRAHKTVSQTGQLMQRGLITGAVLFTVLVVAIGLWMFRVTHRIVRPVHMLHHALDELVAGNLGVRLELHRHDEFQQVSAALNRLVEEFSTVLAKVHDLADDVEALAAEVAEGTHDASAEARLYRLAKGLHQTVDFFRREPLRVIGEEV